MKMKRIARAFVIAALLCALTIQLVGCSDRVNLMTSVQAKAVEPMESLTDTNALATDFAARLFRETRAGADPQGAGNTLISPLSVLYALGMTANGAEGETLTEMEAVIGMPPDRLNRYVYSYMDRLPDDKHYRMSLAHSIWITDDEAVTVNPSFLQTNADYYDAAMFRAPFHAGTCRDINRWVKAETRGMIPEILDQIPPEAVMYLVNALAFEAKWEEPCRRNQIRAGTFTREDGTKQEMAFLHAAEGVYVEDERTTGFVKFYQNRKYAFVALLPREGISIADYAAALDGKALRELLIHPEKRTVETALPAFSVSGEADMTAILRRLGMERAFDEERAEFGNLGRVEDGNLYINRFLHKAELSVDGRGTMAGAAAAAEVGSKEAADETARTVILDRPFVFLVVDWANRVPLFMGTLESGA